MSRMRVLICPVDEHNPETMTQLAQFDLPETDVAALKPETALDEIEGILSKIARWMKHRCSHPVQTRSRILSYADP